MDREYIKIPQSTPLPNFLPHLKDLNDETWKNEIFHHLLSFYRNYNSKDLNEKIEKEKLKQNPRVEREIAKFIRVKLNANKQFGYHFKAIGEETNDEDVEGNYDITIHSTNWKTRDFHFECKNLDSGLDLINKYVYYNKGHQIYDGGVYRYFNGKYAQKSDFGGMIGFVLKGNLLSIKNKIFKKLERKFDITPEGDLLRILDGTIQGNDFTFESIHERNKRDFLIHHLLFDFS